MNAKYLIMEKEHEVKECRIIWIGISQEYLILTVKK